jgi:hypothetical protein
MRKETVKNQSKLFTGWKIFYCLAFITGAILSIFEVYLYRLTIISVTIPVSIILTVGVSTFLFGRSHYKRNFNTRGIFFPLFQNIISWGFISCYIFMAVNYYGADSEVRRIEFEIKSKSSMPGSKGNRDKRSPLVTINYFGMDKELVFKYVDTKRVHAATKVTVTVKRGLFGFDVLDHCDVVD